MEKDQLQKISVIGTECFIIDSIQNLRAEDSFIIGKNKLSEFSGSGEARKYIGSYNGEKGKKLNEFFEYQNWGQVRGVDGQRTYPSIQNKKCFFTKSNLLGYLKNAEKEYSLMEQDYKYIISDYYKERWETIESLSDEDLLFSIYDVSDFSDSDSSRAYIRSNDKSWKYWRQLILPHVSYLSILKLLPVNSSEDNDFFYYFRIFLDYNLRSIVHPGLDTGSSSTEDLEFSKNVKNKSNSESRSPRFKKEVHDHMPQCPFTKITDERLLIASHIKPFQICIHEGNTDEANDKLNGISLSPTYDWLFDQGYITFDNQGNLICGTLLSPMTWSRLKINPSIKNKMRIYPNGREDYLEYHRNNVFQG